MKLIHAMTALTLLVLAGCHDGKTAKHQVEPDMEEEPLPERFENDDLPKAADELFDDFMYYFASNEDLQRRRITFPLPIDTGEVTEAEWQMDPFFTEAGQYTLIFNTAEERELENDTTINEVVVEKIFLTEDSVKQYRFLREEGRWHLTAISRQSLGENANAAFLKFYQKFATDSIFQQKSLMSEIEFTGPDPDDDFAEMEGFITPDSWEAFAPELPCNTIYNIVYRQQPSRTKEKVFVICGISNGMETELTFRQVRGRWKLAKLNE
ncbi:MAG: DUF4348 domain-containing protein [Prevotella sp.]|nr:DUF4348 domain-containing protein [Prevotella sp.]